MATCGKARISGFLDWTLVLRCVGGLRVAESVLTWLAVAAQGESTPTCRIASLRYTCITVVGVTFINSSKPYSPTTTTVLVLRLLVLLLLLVLVKNLKIQALAHLTKVKITVLVNKYYYYTSTTTVVHTHNAYST